MPQGTQTGANNLKGWVGEGNGREFWEGRDFGVPMADFYRRLTENNNSVKQLTFN